MSVTVKQSNQSNTNFRLLVVGQTVTLFGSALLRFALSLHVLDVTGRADVFATLYAISAVPLLLSPIGGAIADRLNRRNLMVAIDATNGAITLALIVMLLVKDGSIMAIGTAMLLFGVTSAMESPTVMACIPSVVPSEKLVQANGIISGTGSLAQIAAPVLGGVFYGIMGLNSLLVAGCVAFFLASGMEIFIRMPFEGQSREDRMVKTIAKDMRKGFAYVKDQPLVRNSMILAALLNLFLSPFFIVGIPIILRVTMNADDTLYGIGMALVECAMLLGAVAAGLFSKRMGIPTLHRWLIFIAALFVPLSAALVPSVLELGQYPSFAFFFLFALPILMIVTLISIYVIAHVQRVTPNEMLGKVMAIIMAVSQCAAPIGQVIYGFIFESFSKAAYVPALLAGAITVLIAVVARTMLRNKEVIS
jgi:MFS family permease